MKILPITGTCLFALGACSTPPTPLPDVAAQLATTEPAIASAVTPQNPLSGYTYRGPTDPRNWRAVNDAQSEGH